MVIFPLFPFVHWLRGLNRSEKHSGYIDRCEFHKSYFFWCSLPHFASMAFCKCRQQLWALFPKKHHLCLHLLLLCLCISYRTTKIHSVNQSKWRGNEDENGNEMVVLTYFHNTFPKSLLVFYRPELYILFAQAEDWTWYRLYHLQSIADPQLYFWGHSIQPHQARFSFWLQCCFCQSYHKQICIFTWPCGLLWCSPLFDIGLVVPSNLWSKNANICKNKKIDKT